MKKNLDFSFQYASQKIQDEHFMTYSDFVIHYLQILKLDKFDQYTLQLFASSADTTRDRYVIPEAFWTQSCSISIYWYSVFLYFNCKVSFHYNNFCALVNQLLSTSFKSRPSRIASFISKFILSSIKFYLFQEVSVKFKQSALVHTWICCSHSSPYFVG